MEWEKFRRIYAVPLLGLSLLMNLAGFAGLIEGIVEWGGFLKNILGVYRTTLDFVIWPVREYLAINVPNFILDGAVVYGSTILILKIFYRWIADIDWYEFEISELRSELRNGRYQAAVMNVLRMLLPPYALVEQGFIDIREYVIDVAHGARRGQFSFVRSPDEQPGYYWILSIGSYIGVILVILFLNYQLMGIE